VSATPDFVAEQKVKFFKKKKKFFEKKIEKPFRCRLRGGTDKLFPLSVQTEPSKVSSSEGGCECDILSRLFS
jgi:hypothetical protein